MKKGLISVVLASAVLGATSVAFAGAYGEAEQPEEIPAPAPAAAPAPEPEPPRVMRKFSGFLTDAETTRGLWAEIGSVYAMEYHPDDTIGDSRAVRTYTHISYGQEQFEVGATIPYYWVEQESIGDRDDFGDLRLWGKYIPVRTDIFTFGLGLITSFPTAGSGLGYDEYGFEPYLTFGVLAGPASIRGSLGYEVTTAPDFDVVGDNGRLEKVDNDVFDNTDANLAVLVPVHEMVVVRAELTHNHYVNSDADPVSIIPGADISFDLGRSVLILRPTIGIGLTEAPDWQAGLGIALNVGI